MGSARFGIAQNLALGLVASFLLASGLMMMKARAGALPIARGRRTIPAVVAWIRDPIWLGGLAVQAVGYALYVIALAGAPVSMMAVAMQGGIALFVFFAVVFLGERARPWEWVGIVTFVVAAVMLAGSLGAEASENRPDIFALAISSLIAVAIGLVPLANPRLRRSGAASAIASGLAFGLGSLYTKALADELAGHASFVALATSLIASPYTYLIAVANVAGLVMLQNSFGLGRGLIAMPTSSAVSNLVPIAGGIAVFGERLPTDPATAAFRLGAFVLTVAASAALAAGDIGAADSARIQKQN